MKRSVNKNSDNNSGSDNILAILTHILGLFTSFLGPLIIFLASEEKYVKKHSKNALNWQLSLIIYFIGAAILTVILIGFVLMAALGVINLVFCIIAAVRASEKKFWEYPLTIKFFK
jgi:hypothetical protein